MSSDQIGFDQVAQLINKFKKMGWSTSRITQLGQAPVKKFRAIEKILDGVATPTALAEMERKSGEDTTYLRYVASATIAPTTGSTTLAQASDVFTGYLDSDFQNWGTNMFGTDTEEATVDIHEMRKDGTFAQLFGSVSTDPRSFCLSQGQIKEFCRTNRHLLRQGGYGTFFLFEANGKLFVARVLVFGGELEACVRHFGRDDVWYAGLQHRLVVPQQTV